MSFDEFANASMGKTTAPPTMSVDEYMAIVRRSQASLGRHFSHIPTSSKIKPHARGFHSSAACSEKTQGMSVDEYMEIVRESQAGLGRHFTTANVNERPSDGGRAADSQSPHKKEVVQARKE